MQLTVTTLSDQIFTLEVGEDLDLASFKGLCELEVGVPAQQIAILWNGRPLQDDRLTLKQYGINNGDMLLLQQIQGQAGQSQGAAGQIPPPPGIYHCYFEIIQFVFPFPTYPGHSFNRICFQET